MLMPRIPEFFTDKAVFITGGTGFLGKALVEKLLRSCPQIGTIYMLVRPKRGKQLHERILALTSEVLFDRIKTEHPDLDMTQKIVPLAGDATQLGLGLSSTDRKLLTENVHLIFHLAATVRFDEALTDAIIMNVRGTREVCQLALDARHLVTLMHVSTAFVNCDRRLAEEVLYPPKTDWRQMIEIAEKSDQHLLAALTEKYLGGMPNTYCFTKNVAEHLVSDMCKGKIPVKIFRPSIVVHAIRDEPIVGWTDSFNGPTGLYIAYGKGILRTFYANESKTDCIPVDVVTKALVVSAWDLALRGPAPQAEVLHCTAYNTAEYLRTSFASILKRTIHFSEKVPFNNALWMPSTHTTTSKFVWYVRTILFMLIPALFVDGILKMRGKKPMLMKIQRKLFVVQLAVQYFFNNEFSFSNDNLLELQKLILKCDAPDWDYEFGGLDFNVWMESCILGTRRYLLHEPDDTLPAARVHFARMRLVQRVVHGLLVAFIAWMLWNSGIVQTGFQCMLDVLGCQVD